MSLADELVDKLYSILMSIGYYGHLGVAPDVQIRTTRRIAQKSIDKWQRDKTTMVAYAKEHLENKHIQWMTYELDIATASRL